MAKTFAKFITGALDRLGLVAVAKWRWNDHQRATHTQELLRLLSIDCILDVGANTGQYAHFLRTHVGYNGEILSFEPVPEMAGILADRAKSDPLWHVFPCALGAAEGSLPINVTKGKTLNSFLSPTPSGLDSLDTFNTVVRTEMVPVRTLDSVLTDLKPPPTGRRIFLKLDTQGYDQEVLKGAAGSLSEISALQTEVSCLPIYHNMPDYLQMLDFLRKSGFDVTGMFPVLQDQWLRVVEFDCVAINRNRIPR